MVERENHQASEELANTLTHGFGLLLSLTGFIILLFPAISHGSGVEIAACLIYGLSLLCLYGSSTYYHWLTSPNRKMRAQLLDHCSIYLLIAGTYTPFALVVLKGGLGWIVFGSVWMLAFAGICFKSLSGHRASALSTASYVLMGWLSVFLMVPLFKLLSPSGFFFLVAGGVAYTAGVYFYAKGSRRFHHAIWHVFVLAGSLCHYAAIFIVITAL